MMAGHASIVVEIDTFLDCRGYKPKHLLTIVLLCIEIIANGTTDPKVNAEPCTQPSGESWHGVTLKDGIDSLDQASAQGVNVRIKGLLTIGLHRCHRGSDHYRVRVVRAAVLAIALWH